MHLQFTIFSICIGIFRMWPHYKLRSICTVILLKIFHLSLLHFWFKLTFVSCISRSWTFIHSLAPSPEVSSVWIGPSTTRSLRHHPHNFPLPCSFTSSSSPCSTPTGDKTFISTSGHLYHPLHSLTSFLFTPLYIASLDYLDLSVLSLFSWDPDWQTQQKKMANLKRHMTVRLQKWSQTHNRTPLLCVHPPHSQPSLEYC